MRFVTELSRLAVLVGMTIAVVTGATARDYHVEYAFQGVADGSDPDSSLLGYHGKLYGTNDLNEIGLGNVYSFDPKAGALAVVHDFNGEGGFPGGAGLIDFGGKLYGTLDDSGAQKNGTIYSLDPATGQEQVVYAFEGGANGCYPRGNLIKLGALLYGVTVGCGEPKGQGNGIVYSFNPATGAMAVIHAFKGYPNDGSGPTGGLTAVARKLYGTTSNGGGSPNCFLGCGAAFEVDPSTGAETVLHSFVGDADGQLPSGGLSVVDAMLYGVASQGGGSENCGSHGCGVIFSLDPATHAEKVLHVFTNGRDGAGPVGHMTDVGMLLYGVTTGGGAKGYGTVFAFDLGSGSKTIVHAFWGGADGASPVASLTYSRHRLYGTAGGGAADQGIVFSINP